MTTLTWNESIAWLAAHDWAWPFREDIAQRDTFPTHKGYAHLAKYLAFMLERRGKVLATFYETDVWPSTNFPPVARFLRNGMGVDPDHDTRPGQLISPEHRDELISIILLALWSVWDLILATEDGGVLVFISHDEMIDVYSKKAPIQELYDRAEAAMVAEWEQENFVPESMTR